MAHRYLHTFLEPFVVFTTYFQFIDNHLDVMILVSVNLHTTLNLLYLSIYAYIEVSFTPHTFKEFAIMSFALTDQRGEDEDAMVDILVKYHFHHLFLCIFYHLLSRQITICRTSPCIEQTQIIVYFGSSSDR